MATPEIRFEGFESEWAKRKLDKSFDFLATNTLSRAQLNYSAGEALNIHYGDVLTILEDVTRVNETTLPFINDPHNFQKNSSNRLLDGDVVIADTAEDETVGKATEVQGISDTPVFSGLHTFACRPTVKFSPGFLGYYLNSPHFHEQIVAKAQGTKVSSISKSQLQETEVSLPELAEQTSISKYFTSLDSLLNGARKSAEQLKNFKQSMLVKMFPQGGASVPDIRFEGFTGHWNEYALGDFGSVAMNKRIFKYQTSAFGEVPFYKIGTFGKLPDSFISRELYDEYTKIYPHPKPGDILISASGSIGRTIEYKGEVAYFQDSNIVWLNHDERLDNRFLEYFYAIVHWSGVEGTTIKRLYNENILKTKILVPSPAEQAAIGSYFRQLDQLIELAEAKLAKLTQLKTAFLSKMFV